MSGRRSALVAAVVLAAASGCGGDSEKDDARRGAEPAKAKRVTDADKAERVAKEYMAALNSKNESRACELQTASSQEERGGCSPHSVLQVIPRSPKFGAPEIAGGFARVLVTGPNGSVTLELTKEGGDWKVAEYQGQLAE